MHFWECWALNGMYFAVSINVIFLLHINLSSPLAPLWGEIDTCPQGLFGAKCNTEQLLFDFFEQNAMPNNFYLVFGVRCVSSAALSPKWNVFFVVSINVIFQPYKTSEPRSSTLGEDRNMSSQIFLDKIQCQTPLIWRFFGCDVYFPQPYKCNISIIAYLLYLVALIWNNYQL